MLTIILLSAEGAAESHKSIIEFIKQHKTASILLLIIILVYAVIMTAMVLQEMQKKKLWTGRGDYRKKEKFTEAFCNKSYRALKRFPLTRDYIDKLSYQFRLISPCDSKVIARNTVVITLLFGVVSILAFFLLYIINPRLINLIITFVTIIIINYEIVGKMAKLYEVTLDIEIQHLIEHEIHNYYVKYRVDDALYLSMESLSPNMKVVASQIYQLLLSDDREHALKEYYDNVPNKYLRQFVSLCVGVAEGGDEEVNGKYMFVRNMENLYSQLEIEIEKLQRLNMEFMGVMFIVLLPLFSIDIVKWFCINLKETLKTFFYGKTGFLIDIGLLGVTTAIYITMRKSAEYISFRQSKHKWLYALDNVSFIKKALDNYCDKFASKMERLRQALKYSGYNIKPRHFILRGYLVAMLVFFVGLCVANYLNFSSKDSLLKVDVSYTATLTSAADENQYQKMAEIIGDYTKKYIFGDENGIIYEVPEDTEKIVTILENDKVFYNKLINEALAKEILQRVNKYNSIHLSFFDIFICVLIGVAAYYMPIVILKYNSTASKDARDDEVNQYNALIGMLMYNPSITVRQILIEMESYSVVFKQSIRNCINNFSAGDIKALERLKEEEPYGPFVRIVENLIRCDDMPAYEAFHEVDVEREGYLSKRKLANEKSIRKRVIRAYIFAAIPLVLLFLYGIIPTLQASMKEITDTFKALDGSL